MSGFFRRTTRIAFYILFAILGVAIGLGLTVSIIMAMVAASGGPEYLNGGNQFALGMLMLLIGSIASVIGLGVGLFFAHRFLARILPLPANVLADRGGGLREGGLVQIFVSGAMLVALTSAGVAQPQKQTVQSLLADGYTVVGVMPSNAGPGIFLSKGQSLIVCFAAETPKSEAVETRYCKPVR